MARTRRGRLRGGKVASPAWVARLKQPASARQQAPVVVTGSCLVAAEARWALGLHFAGTAEFAIVVADAWQRMGIGQRLMRAVAATEHSVAPARRSLALAGRGRHAPLCGSQSTKSPPTRLTRPASSISISGCAPVIVLTCTIVRSPS